MELWVAVTLMAALVQTVRFVLQKSLAAGRLSAAGATFARFAYAAPVMVLGLAVWFAATGHPVPGVAPAFWLWGMFGGAGQVLATVCVVALFAHRNFAVGVTFSKTDVILAAGIGALWLGEAVPPPALAAMGLGLVGVILLSRTPGQGAQGWRHLTSRATLLGLGAGMFFAQSAVAYRAAALAVDTPHAALRAACALAFVTAFQTAIMAAWLAWREPGQIAAVWSARRTAALVGLTGLAGSFGWFWAFALQNAAYVRAVGQVELAFSLVASVLVFHERITRRELAGMALLAVSILGVVLFG